MRIGLLRTLIAALAAIAFLSCTADRIHEPAGGSLSIHFAVENAGPQKDGTAEGSARLPSSSAVDSIRIAVRDLRDRNLASEAIGYAGSGHASIEMSLPAAKDLTVLMSGDGAGPGGRGVLFFGRTSGIQIERGRTTVATILLSRMASEAPVVEGEAGSSSYVVRWRRIPAAASYTLRETSAAGIRDTSLVDTVCVFSPGMAQGSARLSREDAGKRSFLILGRAARTARMESYAGTPASQTATGGMVGYRVRGETPLGPGIFGDSVSVDLSNWFDLPRVMGVTPADSATGVLDTDEIGIRFDRSMRLDIESDTTLATLTVLRDGQSIHVHRRLNAEELILTPQAHLPYGEWCRVRVSTAARDIAGRPLDQDPSQTGLQAFISDFRVEEYDPLRVVSVTPADGATGIATTGGVTLSMQRPVVRSTVTRESFTLSTQSGGVATALPQIDPGGTLLTLTPEQDLPYDTEFTVRLETSVRDSARQEPLDQSPIEAGLQPFVSTFRTAPQPLGPAIVSTTPAAGEGNHPIYEPVVIVFDREIRSDTFRPGETVLLQRNSHGSWFNVALRPAPYSTDGRRFTLAPTLNLGRGADHRLIVLSGLSGIRDADGIAFDADYQAPGFQDFEARFTTETNVRVTASNPADGENQVPWDVEVRLTLDGPIRSESVSDTTFGLLVDGLPVAGSRWISSDLREIRFRPDEPLLGYRTYTVWIGTGMRSSTGGSFDQSYDLDGHQPFSARFTTVQETDPPRVDSVVPSNGATGVPSDQRIAVAFSEPVRSFLVADNFYITLADSAGPKVTAAVSVAADNQSAELTPAAPLLPLTVYHIHVDPLLTDLFGNGLDQDPDKPGKQKFHSIFTTERERIPPRVVAVSPLDGSIGAPVDGPVRIDFSEPIDRTSLTAALRIGTGGGASPGAIAYENGDSRAIWTPSLPLLYESLYEVRVDTLLVDLSGNRLDQLPGDTHSGNDPFVSFFSTAADLQGPRLQTVTPADGASGVDVTAAPVLLFDEALDPSTLAAGILLADSLGAEVSTTPVLSPDSTEVTLGHGTSLAFETRYRITISPALTDVHGNSFDGSPSTPGNQSWTSSFRTQVETIPPWVTSVDPADHAANVDPDTLHAVTVVFSEPCDPSTLDGTSFRLLLSGASVLAGRALSPDGTIATLTPDSALHYLAAYEVRVEGVRDLKGNILDQDPLIAGPQPFVSNFSTVPQPAPAPSVISASPASGTLQVNPGLHPRIVFSRAMDVTTFTSANPGILRRGISVATARTAEPGDTAFVLTPLAPLAPGPYTWFVTSSLHDTQGNPLDQDPGTPGSQPFKASFEVGKRPVANAGPGICSDGEVLSISFDGRSSTDPDGNIAAIRGSWDWGDGTASTFSDSSGLRATHTYPCADSRGCDGLDNDADGRTDETGAGGCDESYHVILTLEDEDYLRAADTTGVAFCAFLARTSDPAGGAAGVDTLQTVRVRLTSACNSSSVDTTSVRLVLQGGGNVPLVRGTEDQDRVLVLNPVAPLLPDTTYSIHIGGSLLSATGNSFDQAPCSPGLQEFLASFRTAPRPGLGSGGHKNRSATMQHRTDRP